MSQARMNQRTSAYMALLLVAVIWGIAGPVIKYTLDYVPPFLFLFLRLAIATAVIIPFLLPLKKTNRLPWKQLPALALLGILGTTVTLALFFLGFEKTSAVEGSLLSILAPILIVIGGALFLKEEVTPKERLGVAIAILGSLIVTLGPLIENGLFGVSKEHIIGNLTIIGANITWAAYTLWSKKLLTQRISPLIQTGISFSVGTVTSFPLALWEWYHRPNSLLILTESFTPWMGILYMAIFSSVVAYFLYEWGFEKIEASEATLFAYLQPLFSLPAAYIILGEIPHRMFWIGALVIAAGIILTEWRERSTLKKVCK